MNIKEALQIDDQIFKALDLVTIDRVICHTNKGILTLQIRKGEKNYHLVLDAVPLEKENNKELMELLFPVKQMEVPQVNKHPDLLLMAESKKGRVVLPRRSKVGRPPGSKTGIVME